MKTCIAVARISSDEQAAADKTSIDTQLEAIRTWARPPLPHEPPLHELPLFRWAWVQFAMFQTDRF